MRWIFAALLCLSSISPTRSALISLYTFDESSGSSAADSVRGAGGIGTIVGSTTFVPGKIGNALSLDGLSYLTSAVVGGGLSQFSISAWVKFNTAGSWASIVKNWGETASGAFHLGLDSAGSKLSNYSNSSGVTTSVSDASNVSTGLWYHVVMTYNGGAGGQQRLYVNGTQKGSASASGTLTTTGTKMSMGAKLNDAETGVAGINTGWLNGALDDVAFYNETLSGTQVTTLYNNGLSGVGAIPEPSAFSLLAVGLGVLFRRSRKRD